MSAFSFKPYEDAYSVYTKDLAQLTGISNRLIASAEGVEREPISASSKLGKLKSIRAQLGKVEEGHAEAKKRFDAARGAADEHIVNLFAGLAAYGLATGKGGAALRYLQAECRDYDAAKGNIEGRRVLYDRIGSILDSVVDAVAGEKPSGSTDIVARFESIQNPEDASSFYREHQAEIQKILTDRHIRATEDSK